MTNQLSRTCRITDAATAQRCRDKLLSAERVTVELPVPTPRGERSLTGRVLDVTSIQADMPEWEITLSVEEG